jgi:uncharacterized membrane protein YdbT with pleckstrin-like domain
LLPGQSFFDDLFSSCTVAAEAAAAEAAAAIAAGELSGEQAAGDSGFGEEDDVEAEDEEEDEEDEDEEDEDLEVAQDWAALGAIPVRRTSSNRSSSKYQLFFLLLLPCRGFRASRLLPITMMSSAAAGPHQLSTAVMQI